MIKRRRLKIYFLYLTAALFNVVFFVNCSTNSSPTSTEDSQINQENSSSAWRAPVGALIQGATLSDGWYDLREAGGGLNLNGGWTDSVAVSSDGQSLLFSYSRYDFSQFQDSLGLTWVVTGAPRTGMTGDYFKMFSAKLSADRWDVSFLPFNGSPTEHEFAASANTADDIIVFSRWISGKGDLFFSIKTNGVWGPPLSIGAVTGGSQVNSACSDDNGFIVGSMETGIRLYFESDRADLMGTSCGGNTHIYYSDFDPITNSFSPVQLVPGINGSGPTDKDFQPFFSKDKSKAYWTVLRSNDYGVYSADLSPGGTYTNLRSVVRPTFTSPFVGKLVLVGEANVAEVPEGWLMYMMCGIAQSESSGKATQIELKICVARKNR
jgi:hypothetical protein